MKTRDEIQAEMVDAVALCVEKSNSAVIEAATGVGKTKVAADVVRHLSEAKGWKAVFLVDEVNLREQSALALEHWGLRVAVEGGERRASDLELLQAGEVDVLVATRQTLARNGTGEARYRSALFRLGWPKAHILIVDECHVGITGKELKAVRSLVKPEFTLGLSATPYLSSGVKLVPEIFDETAYRYPAEDADGKPGAISNGHLVPPYCLDCQTSVDLRGLKTAITSFGKDYNSGELDRLLAEHVGELVNAARQQIELNGPATRGICFCSSVALAEAFASVWRSVGCTSEAMHGQSPDAEAIKAKYQNGEIQVLCVCQMGTKGFDDPPTDFLVLARPTKSYPLARQMVGRGLRLCPETNKTRCLIIGFAWQADESAEPVSVLDIFSEGLPENVRSIAKGISSQASRDGGAVNPLDIINTAKIEAESRERAGKKPYTLASAERRDVEHKVRIRDIFGNEYEVAGVQPIKDDLPAEEAAAESQLRRLEAIGVPKSRISGMTSGTADRILHFWEGRGEAGMSTYKQANLIMKHKKDMDMKAICDLTKDEASRIISKIMKRWKR